MRRVLVVVEEVVVAKMMMMMRQMQVERVNLFIYVFIYCYSYFLSSSFWRGYDSPRVDYGAPHASGMPRCCSQFRVAGKSGLQANQAWCGGLRGGFRRGFAGGCGVDSGVALNFAPQKSLCFRGLRARPLTPFILLIRGKQFAKMMRRP